jgi:hypothetical protein
VADWNEITHLFGDESSTGLLPHGRLREPEEDARAQILGLLHFLDHAVQRLLELIHAVGSVTVLQSGTDQRTEGVQSLHSLAKHVKL